MLDGNFQHDQNIGLNNIKSRLLYLVTEELWDELENEVVSFNFGGQPISFFAEDVWDFKPYRVGTEYTTLNFKFSDLDVSSSLLIELKSIALAFIYHSQYAYRISSVTSKINSLKRLAISLTKNGIETFDGLTIDCIRKMIKKDIYLPREIDLAPLNSLNDLSDYLSFNTNFFEKLTLKKLNVLQPDKEQHPVIPLRIYLAALDAYSNKVQYWHPLKNELEQAIQGVIDYEHNQIFRMLKRLRNGECGVGQVFNNNDKKSHQFISELNRHNIPMMDYERNPEWDRVWRDVQPQVRTDFFERFAPRTIGNKTFDSHHELKSFCLDLDRVCRYLVLCLSGMRSNELLQITPNFGAQIITLDGIDIHLFHTKQQKITSGYQGYDDVYVTTKNGHLAYELLNSLNRPVRNWLGSTGQKAWLLNNLQHFRQPRSISRSGNISQSLTRLFLSNEQEFSIELNSKDVEMLRRSDPEKEFNIGEKWHLTPHQLRRSLAYYLVGMQLADYPQLKQQFSHYSIAMTMYYARNASSFQKMFHDLEKEKVRQQALLYSRLTAKAYSGEKLGGGQGKNMYSESYVDRNISPQYYEKEIKSGRKHIHALAPGMYCINNTCSMRIGIEIGECVDCDWAVIESGAYAQAVRQESINILKGLQSKGELTADIIAFQEVRIRSAEKILNDLDISYTPYQASEYLITSTI